MEQSLNRKILEILKSEPTEYVSGESLCEILGVSRTAVWKHIETLRSLGYVIEAFPHRGYRLVEAPDKLLAEELSHALQTKVIGKAIFFHEIVSSTNDLAYALAEKGAGEGAVVVADEQTKGKGRLGRTWMSPKGSGVYLSVILRPALSPQSVPKVTLFAALAAARAVRKITGVTAQIRWPNDLLIGGKKIAGVLTEMSGEQDRVHFVIVGIGINVNTSAERIPKEGTSLKIETGKEVSRIMLTRALLEELDALYRQFTDGENGEPLEECRKLSSVLGTHVMVEQASGRKEGYAIDIDDEGALLLRLDDGFTARILSGDLVKLR